MITLKKYFAEMVGTFVLVFIGCGSAVIAGNQIGFLGISLAFGLAVLGMVYSIGPVSGCHINPAVTIAMLSAGKISTKDSIWYIAAQCVGAVAGSLILLSVASGLPGYAMEINGLGQNGYDNASPMKFSMGSGFIAEVVLTFIFILVIFGATDKKASTQFAGIAIGFTLVIVHLIGIPITGTSVNPARSLGPAIILGGEAIKQLWLFWLAPILGGILAAFTYKTVFSKIS